MTETRATLERPRARETRSVFKWFWAWEDEREETWLATMARQGWHLREVGVPGFYVFERGAPRAVAYRLDFKFGGRDWNEYRQLFADAGWEYVGRTGNWIYFRKEAVAGEADEIYTDATSKVRKYRSVLAVLAVFLAPLVIPLSINGFFDYSGSTFRVAVSVVGSLLVLLYVYAMVRIAVRIRELNRRL
jgi:hypothetical protein